MSESVSYAFYERYNYEKQTLCFRIFIDPRKNVFCSTYKSKTF